MRCTCALIAAALPSLASATPFNQLPGIGPVPDPCTPAFLEWTTRLTGYRIRECRDVPRATYYVQLGPAGGGDGLTPETAWTEPDLPSLQSRLDSLGTDWRVLLKRGEMWRGTSGLILDTEGAALGAWGDGPKPIITSFYPLTDASPITLAPWQIDAGVGTIDLTGYDDDAVWVSRSAQNARRAWDESQYYARVATPEEVVAGSGTFCFDTTTGHLTVATLPGDAFEELEASTANTAGVIVKHPADLTWVDGLHVSGWSMGADTQSYSIRTSIQDEEQALVSGCYADAANRHAIGAANGGRPGGISTFVGNEAGACRAIRGATNYIGFASKDGEFIFLNNLTSGYKLQEPNTGPISSYYSHGSGSWIGMNRFALVKGHRTLPGTSDYLPQLSNLQPVDGDDSPALARGFIVAEVYDSGQIDHSGKSGSLIESETVRVNCWVRLASIGSALSNTYMFKDATTNGDATKGRAIGCIFILDYSQVTHNSPFSIIRLTGLFVLASARAEHCLFHIVPPTNQLSLQAFTGFSFDAGDQPTFVGGGWRITDSIIQVFNPIAAGAWINIPNASPGDEWWGGQEGNAYFNLTPSDGYFGGPRYGYDHSPGFVTLTEPVEPKPNTIVRARPLDHADTEASPRPLPALSTSTRIGPGGIRLPCAADLTTANAPPGDPLFGHPDGLVTSADLQYYVNLWVALDPAADLTTINAPEGTPLYGAPDGTVGTIDLLYYVNAWVAGCP